jgi:hypothetical protein
MLRTKQLSVSLPNRSGQLAKLSQVLADAKVNIVALSVAESTEAGTVRLVADKPKEAAEALKKAGMAPIQTNVLVLSVPNRVGMLAEVCQKLTKKKVNINFIYGSTGRGRGAAQLVLRCPNLAAARSALRGF